MSETDRIRWRCRRGLLELDIVLTRFMESRFEGLTPAERDIFLGLLDLADNDLWDLIAGRQDIDDEGQRGVLAQLRAA